MRMPGRDDVVLQLEPGRMVRVALEHGRDLPIIGVSVLLIDDGTGDVTPDGLHIDEQQPANVVQAELFGGPHG